jgi:Na+-transporting NADH:ubiquinone oxidoreductase subunit F
MLIEQETIILSMIAFTSIVLILVTIILIVRSWLVASGQANILINHDPDHQLQVPIGDKLMQVLANKGIYLPSACGGCGTCGQCRVVITEGGGDVLASEKSTLNHAQIRNHYRLACQVAVKDDLEIELPVELLKIHKWACVVRSNRCVATFIKELILELPPGKQLNFRAGGYILLEAPPYSIAYADFDIDPKYRPSWDKFNLWQYQATLDKAEMRAYSMANYPDEKEIVMLNVRIASPPPKHPEAPPGKVSSYIYSLKPGDKVNISGPYGEFYARETVNEMIFIGGGSGMAPMRSHIFDQLKRLHSKRKISFWYGARSLGEVFYIEDFNSLAEEFENFEWTIGLSEPLPEDNWKGETGFIHQILYEKYLKNHPAPEDCEYYLCGPPMMISSIQSMLFDLGVDAENILFDKFGG